MKYIIHESKNGYRKRVLVKDSDNDSEAEFGIPAGPPDIRMIDWDLLKKQVNNTLADNGAFTWDDAQRHQVAIKSAVSVFKRHLISLYRLDAKKEQ